MKKSTFFFVKMVKDHHYYTANTKSVDKALRQSGDNSDSEYGWNDGQLKLVVGVMVRCKVVWDSE